MVRGFIRQFLFDEVFPRKEVWRKRWRLGETSKRWGVVARHDRGTWLDSFQLGGHLGEFQAEEELFMLDGHQLGFEGFVLTLNVGFLVFKLFDFLSLALA